MRKFLLCIFLLSLFSIVDAQNKIKSYKQLTLKPFEYEKTEFSINISAQFNNPYQSDDIELDMHLISPSGKGIFLPCFYSSGDSLSSIWKARFAAQEVGTYTYYFNLIKPPHESVKSDTSTFTVAPSNKNGFLHVNGLWTLKFDSGKLFRGIGEDVAWESRSFENPKWSYDYFLPKLAHDSANFFRTWMCAWNLPLEWERVHNTKRYKSTNKYYNPGGIKRMDQLVSKADSLGMYIMLTLGSGGTLGNPFWFDSTYNRKDPNNPTKFFTHTSIQQKYKDKLRYIIARWGYSTSIAAIEFFNEIDNSAYTRSPQDSAIISQEAIAEWHSEMSRYLHDIDPYHHIITTSISHRDIMGLDILPYIDINQKHIYKRTEQLRPEILRYTKAYNKPYVIGEFGYEWDWNKDFSKITKGLLYDYKRGLWYGLFSPTPILPMSWWWEYFDKHNMTPYFKGVREISDQMLAAGNGSFKIVNADANIIEAYGLKCGEQLFVYLLNNSNVTQTSDVILHLKNNANYTVTGFNPDTREFIKIGTSERTDKGIKISGISLKSKKDIVLELVPQILKAEK